ncbi:50S ribosomal protein L34e [Candidatus Bathyarchaeota archaeon]|nr:50S ribosomal protein L34e [Candidatus Bathyarchaeota archaeon]
MPKPSLRAGASKKVKVKLPGGRSTVHYKKRKANKALCSICKGPLHGVSTIKLKKLSKSKKAPSRIFGGILCHSCLQKSIKEEIRGAL